MIGNLRLMARLALMLETLALAELRRRSRITLGRLPGSTLVMSSAVCSFPPAGVDSLRESVL